MAVRPIKSFTGLVWTKAGRCYEMTFDVNSPLSGFDVSELPPEIDCVEIIDVQHEGEA